MAFRSRNWVYRGPSQQRRSLKEARFFERIFLVRHGIPPRKMHFTFVTPAYPTGAAFGGLAGVIKTMIVRLQDVFSCAGFRRAKIFVETT